uniref:SFRICE_026629 n=1 Tax=Spodoptera frugiperda TaxID=7108 RepID=A0A2H1WK47_SPOFR
MTARCQKIIDCSDICREGELMTVQTSIWVGPYRVAPVWGANYLRRCGMQEEIEGPLEPSRYMLYNQFTMVSPSKIFSHIQRCLFVNDAETTERILMKFDIQTEYELTWWQSDSHRVVSREMLVTNMSF